MEQARGMRGALMVVAIAIIGCGQSAGGQATAIPSSIAGVTPASIAPSATPSVDDTAPTAAVGPDAPVEFTGRIVCGPPVSPARRGTSESLRVGDDGLVLTRYRGGAWNQAVTMSDPRLEGTLYETYESDTYVPTGTEKGPEMFAATHRIENEAGVWESRRIGGAFADGTSIAESDRLEVWIGAGAYAGLVAIMDSRPDEGECAFDVRGIIFSGGPMPVPYGAN